jgi:hypothetical protein
VQNLQPPTDNLYKFLALTGVVVAISAVVGPAGMFYNLRVRESDFAAQTAAAKADDSVFRAAEQFEKERRADNAANSALFKQFMAEHPVDTLPADVREPLKQESIRSSQELREINGLGERIVEKAAVADKAYGALEAKRSEIDFLKWTAIVTLGAGVLMLITGVAMAIVGFRLWYLRTQVHQDNILAAEAARVM